MLAGYITAKQKIIVHSSTLFTLLGHYRSSNFRHADE